jgi:hypothetical protein
MLTQLAAEFFAHDSYDTTEYGAVCCVESELGR